METGIGMDMDTDTATPKQMETLTRTPDTTLLNKWGHMRDGGHGNM